MKLRIEVFLDQETGQWGYQVPPLSIVGTGCASREVVTREALAAIEFTLDAPAGPATDGSEIVTYDVQLAPARAS